MGLIPGPVLYKASLNCYRRLAESEHVLPISQTQKLQIKNPNNSPPSTFSQPLIRHICSSRSFFLVFASFVDGHRFFPRQNSRSSETRRQLRTTVHASICLRRFRCYSVSLRNTDPHSTANSLLAMSFMLDDDNSLETIRSRFQSVIRRHAELTERLSRDSDKMIFERLQKEFEAARASQDEELHLDGEEWNDGLLATIRERVHMEADRKVIPVDTNTLSESPFHSKVTYRVGTNKLICCLEGARIGIQYETSFAGEPCELYHCVLESKSFLEKMTVLEHTIPFFLPIREAETDLLSSNAMKFIDHIGELLQAYVDRREQVRVMRELYGNQIGELYHSLPYHMIEFVLDDFDCKVTVSLRYADLLSVLPTRVKVLAWPLNCPSKDLSETNSKASGAFPSQFIPVRLSYAEDALQTMSLPEAFAEIVLNLPRALQQMFPA